MERYTFIVTGKCANDCIACHQKGELQLNYCQPGQSEIEKKGLENLVGGLSKEVVSITGGDPLLSRDFLRAMKKSHKGVSSITINPLSLLSMQSGMSPARMKVSDVAQAYADIRANGLSDKLNEAIGLLNSFDMITMSSGTLQAPNPQIASYSNEFFRNFVLPNLEAKVAYYVLNGDFKEGNFLNIKQSTPTIAGSLRQKLDDGLIQIEGLGKSPIRDFKLYNCNKKDEVIMHFQKEADGMYLYIDSCCSVGIIPQNSYCTGLTVEHMASMKPSEIKERIDSEYEKMKKTILYRMLNAPKAEGKNGLERFVNGTKAFLSDIKNARTECGFSKYLASAEEIVEQKTGAKQSIRENVLALGKHATYCDYCNAAGLMMQRSGITGLEWQDYLARSHSEKQ